MSRRHALVVEVAAVLVALSVALVMLGHATASGGVQWAESALTITAVVLAVGLFVAVLLLAENADHVPAAISSWWRRWRIQRATARQAAQLRRERAAHRRARTGARR